MLLVTGGAGFIGSNVVAALNDAGRADVTVCDMLGHDGKWRNLAKRQLADIVPPAELPDWLKGRRLDAVLHLGAISETTATDGDLVIETNFRLSSRVLARRFDDLKAGRAVQLFKSHREGIADGDQRRDFIYVDDVVRVMMWLLATPSVSGIFNVGTGKARSFKDLMVSAYAALGTVPNIQYIDMPEQIRGSYQYFTQSDVVRLQRAGYNGGFRAREVAVQTSAKGYLGPGDRLRR